jgi:hypothetical protein
MLGVLTSMAGTSDLLLRTMNFRHLMIQMVQMTLLKERLAHRCANGRRGKVEELVKRESILEENVRPSTRSSGDSVPISCGSE